MVDKICLTLIRCKTKFVCNPIKNSIMKKLILLNTIFLCILQQRAQIFFSYIYTQKNL